MRYYPLRFPATVLYLRGGEVMRRCAFLATVAVCALSGCGTMMNVGGGCCGSSSPKAVYGGVRMDAVAIDEYAQKVGDAKGPGDVCLTAGIMTLVGVDMVASAVADTATLPITLLLTLTHEGKTTVEEKPAAPSSAVTTDAN
jgi:uncharacterized protein YceK